MEPDPVLAGSPMDPGSDHELFAYLVSEAEVSVGEDAEVDDRVS